MLLRVRSRIDSGWGLLIRIDWILLLLVGRCSRIRHRLDRCSRSGRRMDRCNGLGKIGVSIVLWRGKTLLLSVLLMGSHLLLRSPLLLSVMVLRSHMLLCVLTVLTTVAVVLMRNRGWWWWWWCIRIVLGSSLMMHRLLLVVPKLLPIAVSLVVAVVAAGEPAPLFPGAALLVLDLVLFIEANKPPPSSSLPPVGTFAGAPGASVSSLDLFKGANKPLAVASFWG